LRYWSWYYRALGENSNQNLDQLKVDESACELAVKRERDLQLFEKEQVPVQ
jgi:hypothetical protein